MVVSINFIGDIGLFNKFEVAGVDPLKEIQLPVADYSIGNFEFVQPKDNRKKEFYAVDDRYKCSYQYFKSLSLNKFDALGLANNHAMDYGKAGSKDVIKVLDEKKIAWFGVSEKSENRLLSFCLEDIHFLVIGGVSKGRWSKEITGYGPESAGFDRVKQLLESHVGQFDHIIVFLHWGTELVDIPPPGNINLAKKMIDLGASAVIGHHPHVPQGIQNYNNGIIAYSLGSFIYLPDEEPSYDKEFTAQNVSIALVVGFSKKKVVYINPTYYLYNSEKLIPEPVKKGSWVEEYILGINKNIENYRAYSFKVRKNVTVHGGILNL